MAEYQVSFEIFEGPLDLLLYLVRRQEVDIYEVNLTRLAGDFIEYVEMLKVLDLDIAGEFIVMAASLIYIKSKELLPIDQQVVDEEDDDDLDPRWELIRQLVEYKKFKDASRHLQALERAEENIFPPGSRGNSIFHVCWRCLRASRPQSTISSKFCRLSWKDLSNGWNVFQKSCRIPSRSVIKSSSY
ncbi:MAG: segregation/condensation protein A [Verrucomicrobia bacterium]|nr:segregation/condensation protein A [Verrucomicrobiota bacterium]